MRDEWIEWLQDKQRNFFYGVMLIVASVFIAFQLFGKFHKPSNSQFMGAHKAFEKWLVQGEAFEKLETAIKANPELESKFGATIADKFIVQNEGEKAEPFADHVLKRVLKQTPEHTAFAEGSLLIAKGNFTEALVQSVALKMRLEKTSLLYGFNLMRIASLYRVLEVPDQEIVVLEELEKYMHDNEKAASILADCFSEGEISLAEYIAQRKENFFKK